MENGEIQLSHEYHQAIIEIFHQLDLDESGSLSKAEFNLYNWRTSGMEMKVNKTNFFKKRELGFALLHINFHVLDDLTNFCLFYVIFQCCQLCSILSNF